MRTLDTTWERGRPRPHKLFCLGSCWCVLKLLRTRRSLDEPKHFSSFCGRVRLHSQVDSRLKTGLQFCGVG